MPEDIVKKPGRYLTAVQSCCSPVTIHTPEIIHESRGGLKLSGSGVPPFNQALAFARNDAPSQLGNWKEEIEKK